MQTMAAAAATSSTSLSFFHHNTFSSSSSSSLPKLSSFCPPKKSPFTVQAKDLAQARRQDRIARHIRIRKRVEGTPERPRLCVFRSHKHIYVQVIDDSKMHTLASASTMQKPLSEELNYSAGPTIEIAKKVGEAIAKTCLEKGITKVVYDRGGFAYHGRIQAVAEGARAGGLDF